MIILVDYPKVVGDEKEEFVENFILSGVYFYRIQAGSFIDTKKMLLLK